MIGLQSLGTYKRLISRFGLAGGSDLFFNKVVHGVSQRSEWDCKELSVRGLARPIHVRLKTSDWSVFEQIFVRKEYEEPSRRQADALREAYDRILQQNKTPVIVDCGANIGLASVWYAHQFPKAKIVAIEPEPRNFAVLTRNVAGYDNIVPLQAGISDHRSCLSLSNSSDAPWGWETTESATGEVEAITVRDALSKVVDGVPLIVKIDIEGFETDLFRSNLDWIDETPLIVVETHDWLFEWKGTAHSIFSILTQMGRRDYVQHGESTFCYSHELLHRN